MDELFTMLIALADTVFTPLTNSSWAPKSALGKVIVGLLILGLFIGIVGFVILFFLPIP